MGQFFTRLSFPSLFHSVFRWWAPSPFDATTLKAPDGSITVKFVPFGATLTEVWVKDKDGRLRDVILGYDDPTQLEKDPAHPVFNPIVGRYANRIRNGTFSIPIASPPSGKIYNIPTFDGMSTLHGGTIGWDRRPWSTVQKSATSITYKHIDTAHEGFPGTVTAFVTHTVENGGILKTTVLATASEKTPIMLTQHNYWNLDAFETPNPLDNHLFINASRLLEVDDMNIPTGKLTNVEGTPYDFRKSHTVGERLNDDELNYQYNQTWIFDEDQNKKIGVSMWSEESGIKLDITTNQPAVVIYTGNWLNTPRKRVHGGPNKHYTRRTAVAIEQQGWVDAINVPEWETKYGVDQIYYPGRDYEWSSTYKFSTLH